MFERFTDRARRVVVLAQEEAGRLNHNYIGTEHLLLGLINEGEGVAAKALGSLGIRLEAVRQQVEEIIGQGKGMPAGHIPFTPRAKKVLELSLREALDLGHNYIGTEHILLGLIREGEGVAAQVLVKLGAELDRVRDRVVGLLEGGAGRGVVRAGAARAVGPRSQASGVMEQIVSRLEAIEARLLSIERRLTGHPEPAAGLTEPSFGQGSSPQAEPPGRAEPPAGAPGPPAAAAGPATGSEPEPPAPGQDGQDGEDNPPAAGATS